MAEDNNKGGDNGVLGNLIGFGGFSEVVERLKKEGQLVRNTSPNSLKAVKQELKVHTELQSKLLSSFENYFEQWNEHTKWTEDLAAKAEADRLQNLAKIREKVKVTEAADVAGRPDKPFDLNAFLGGGLLAGLVTGIAGAIGGAVAAALSGIGAAYGALGADQIKSFYKNVATISSNLAKGVKFTADWGLGKIFGTSETKGGEKFSYWEEFKKEVARVRESLKLKINEWVLKPIGNLLTNIKTFLGPEIEGPTRPGESPLKGQGPIGKVMTWISNIGKEGGVVSWIGGKVGAIFKFLGKWLTPLAFVFSGIEAIDDAIKQYEESTAKGESGAMTATKTTIAAVGGFLGAFFGGFVDLVKNGLLWVVKKMLPKGWVDENGNIVKEGWVGDVMRYVDEFSFAETIKSIFKVVGEAIDYVVNGLWQDIDNLIKDMKKTFGFGPKLTYAQQQRLAEATAMNDRSKQESDALKIWQSQGLNRSDLATMRPDEINKLVEDKSSFWTKNVNLSEDDIRMLLLKEQALARQDNLRRAEEVQARIKRQQLEEELRRKADAIAARELSVNTVVTDASDKSTTTVNSAPVFVTRGNSVIQDGKEYAWY